MQDPESAALGIYGGHDMKIGSMLVGLVLTALLLVGVACTDDSDGAQDVVAETDSADAAQTTAAMAESSAASGDASFGGIWVIGEASIRVEPDVSYINVGVSSTAETVAEARAEAAAAMEAIIAAVKAHGLTDNDIQTTSFNIWPQYDWVESEEDGHRIGKQVLVGYEVNNSARLTVRDLEAIGQIIDDTAEAGGDATRINGISFSIEDPDQYDESLRESAVADALEKANHLAELAGVSVGKLTYIGRAGVSVPAPVTRGFAFAMEDDSMAASTPIGSGQTEVSMRVQAAFNIE